MRESHGRRERGVTAEARVMSERDVSVFWARASVGRPAIKSASGFLACYWQMTQFISRIPVSGCSSLSLPPSYTPHMDMTSFMA